MLYFEIETMTCDHCVSTIGTSITAIDANAITKFDVAGRSISVDTDKPATEIANAILAAGYPNKQTLD